MKVSGNRSYMIGECDLCEREIISVGSYLTTAARPQKIQLRPHKAELGKDKPYCEGSGSYVYPKRIRPA